jgi:hypothetical protein
MLAHDVRRGWYGSRGWTFPPIVCKFFLPWDSSRGAVWKNGIWHWEVCHWIPPFGKNSLQYVREQYWETYWHKHCTESITPAVTCSLVILCLNLGRHTRHPGSTFLVFLNFSRKNYWIVSRFGQNQFLPDQMISTSSHTSILPYTSIALIVTESFVT